MSSHTCGRRRAQTPLASFLRLQRMAAFASCIRVLLPAAVAHPPLCRPRSINLTSKSLYCIILTFLYFLPCFHKPVHDMILQRLEPR